MYRHLDKPYHVDYIFMSSDKIKDLEICDADKWLHLSDHVR